MSDAPSSRKKLRRGPVDQNNKFCRSEAAQNPINSQERSPDLDQNETDIGPIYMIKGLNQVQFEDEGIDIFCFNRVESLLNNTNWLDDLTVFKEVELFLGDTIVQKGLDPNRNDLRDQFIQQITQ